MTRMTRWNPNRSMSTLEYAVDRLFDDTVRSFFGDWDEENGNVTGFPLPLDVVELDNAYHVTADLPGVNLDNIDVRIEDGVLTINAEVQRDMIEHESARSLITERRYGQFTRSIRLPQQIDSDAVEANYENGVLTLELPKTPESQPKQIAVKAGK